MRAEAIGSPLTADSQCAPSTGARESEGKWEKICRRRRKHGSWEVPAAAAVGRNPRHLCWRIGTLTQLPKSLIPPLWDSISKLPSEPPTTKSPAPSTCKPLMLSGFCTLSIFDSNWFRMYLLFWNWYDWKLKSWIGFVIMSNLRLAARGSLLLAWICRASLSIWIPFCFSVLRNYSILGWFLNWVWIGIPLSCGVLVLSFCCWLQYMDAWF